VKKIEREHQTLNTHTARGRMGYARLTQKIVSVYNQKPYHGVLDCNNTSNWYALFVIF